MYILAFESTGPKLSVAVIDEKGNVTEKECGGTLDHLQNIMVVTESFGIPKGDFAAVAASAGPGSFTGIRIGVSTARALSQALDIPAVSVPSLEAFAYGKLRDGIIAPVIDARRNQVYAAAYEWEENSLKEVIPAGPYMIDGFMDMLEGKGRVTLYGDAHRKYGEYMFGRDIDLSLAPDDIIGQKAGRVARLALEKYKKGETVHWSELMPIYMRRSEAEVKREERLKNEDKKSDSR